MNPFEKGTLLCNLSYHAAIWCLVHFVVSSCYKKIRLTYYNNRANCHIKAAMWGDWYWLLPLDRDTLWWMAKDWIRIGKNISFRSFLCPTIVLWYLKKYDQHKWILWSYLNPSARKGTRQNLMGKVTSELFWKQVSQRQHAFKVHSSRSLQRNAIRQSPIG